MPLFTPEPKLYRNFPIRKKIIILKLVRKYKSTIIISISFLTVISVVFVLLIS